MGDQRGGSRGVERPPGLSRKRTAPLNAGQGERGSDYQKGNDMKHHIPRRRGPGARQPLVQFARRYQAGRPMTKVRLMAAPHPLSMRAVAERKAAQAKGATA